VIETPLPAAVAVVEAFDDVPGEQPYPGEEDLVANAVESRRREFITARRCARAALARLGHAPVPIRTGPHREPQWPAGIAGSITHCRGYRAAAVARRDEIASLGIDAEPHGPLPDGVLESVATPADLDELRRLVAADPGVRWDRLLFSAKESVYKAWYPLTGRWLDFLDADLRVDREAGSFTARLLVDGARTDGGPPLGVLAGRFLVRRGLIVTAVTVTP
jgi:4'-phosphopantetheinyl transferase EntD